MHSSFQLKSVYFFLSVPFRVCANGVPLRGQHSYGFSNRRKWDAVLLPAGESGKTIRLLQEKPCWAGAWYKNWKLDFLEEKKKLTHTSHKQKGIHLYCSHESLHFQSCKTKQYMFFTCIFEGDYHAWLWQYYIKCCPCWPIYVSLCNKESEENDVWKFSFVCSNALTSRWYVI